MGTTWAPRRGAWESFHPSNTTRPGTCHLSAGNSTFSSRPSPVPAVTHRTTNCTLLIHWQWPLSSRIVFISLPKTQLCVTEERNLPCARACFNRGNWELFIACDAAQRSSLTKMFVPFSFFPFLMTASRSL